jgi:EAL domain-containing protein (putative c-di-GMP-specific phosphodiesterase class I)
VNSVRVGIVVPALMKYRNTLIRIFKEVMHPDIRLALPGAKRNIAPFNVSLGLALINYPLIDITFVSLALLDQKVEFNRISYWLRSPFLAGSENEMSQRVLLDAQIRRFSEPEISLERLFILVSRASGGKECPILLQCLSVLRIFRQTRLPESASHTVFARIIAEVLQILGFPGERGLDSSEFQTLKKWQMLVANFAALDQVNAKTSYPEAVSRLRQMAANTLFQPETPNVPVQIIDVFEATGMEFDHLWVMGLSDEQWPLRSHPNPFLPLELQRKAKLPWGSTLESSAYCQRLTRNWLSSAKDIILSYPRYSNDRDGHELKSSPLIRSIPLRESVPHLQGSVEMKQWLPRIQNALTEQRFQLYYQPIQLISSKHAEQEQHGEILLRLQDENGQLIMPGAFLPAAGRHDQILLIDRWVVQQSLQLIKAHATHTINAIYTINISGQALVNEDFLDFTVNNIKASQLDPACICFEISEQTALNDLQHVVRFVTTLKELGCRISIDDFSSNLSSFSYLKDIPLDYLKIDGRLIKNMLTDPVNQAMVESIHHIGHIMRLKTIAVWVENDQTLQILENIGIDYVQGFWVAEPTPLNASLPLTDKKAQE